MASKTNTLEEMCELIVDCPHSTPKWTDDGIIVLRNQNIRNGVLDLSSPSYTNQEDYKKRIKRAIPRAGDIVFTREAPMGEVCMIPDGVKCCLGQRQVLLRPRSDISGKYLFWALQSPKVQHQISWNEGTGTTVSNVRIPVLKSLQIPRLNELEVKVAGIMSSLAHKIELNKKINQTLEQMAQAMFKSWFVDFDPVFDNLLEKHNNNLEKASSYLTQKGAEDLMPKLRQRHQIQQTSDYKSLPDHIKKEFPNDFHHHEDMGWIPEGWQIKSFDSLIEITGGGTPKTSIEEYWIGNIPWFSVVDAPNESDVFVLETEKHISQEGLDNSSARLLREGTTIISARGTVGKCALVGAPMAMNQSCYGLNGIDGVSDEFVYYLVRHKISDLKNRGHGSVFNTITRETFKSIDCVFCGDLVTQKYSFLVKPYLDKILINNIQIRKLKKMSEILLPKLFSSEVSIV